MKDIDQLLNLYFEGKTTLKEEEFLRKYFQQDNIPEKYRMYAPLFIFFHHEQEEIKNKKKKVFSAWLISVASIAAGILIIIGIRSFSFIEKETSHQSLVYIDGKKYSDPDNINDQAIISISNISGLDEEIIDSQIDILNSFTN